MTSLLLDSTHGRQRRAWHDITAFMQDTWSDYVGRGMTSLLLDSTHGRMTSSVACRHRLRAVHTVKRRGASHVVIAFGQHTRSNDVGRGMTSPPLDSTHGRTTLGVTCHHHIWTTHTVGLRRAWHDITALGLHTRSNDVGRGIPSASLGGTNGQMTSGVA